MEARIAAAHATRDRSEQEQWPIRRDEAEDTSRRTGPESIPSADRVRVLLRAPEWVVDHRSSGAADAVVAAQSPDDDDWASSPSYQRSAPTPRADTYSCRTSGGSPLDIAYDTIKSANSDRSLDNGYFFLIGEAFRLTDQGTRLAGRAGMNWGLPVVNDGSGLGFQFGFSGSWTEEAPQWFLTGGMFYRGHMRNDWAWNAGAAFDFVQDDELHSDVGQVRGKTSLTLNPKMEIGLWGAVSVLDDEYGGHSIESMDQVNGFYRYLFESGTDFTGWAGWRQEPSSFAFGMNTYTPIAGRWAGVFGMYYAFHGDNWNVFSGLVWHWCDRGEVEYLGQDRHQPYFPVADNTSMTLFEKR